MKSDTVGRKGAIRRLALLATMLALAGCTGGQPRAGGAPARSDNAYCAELLDQFDSYEYLPMATAGFNFRQMQLSRIRQAGCLTFTRHLADLEAVQARLAPPKPFRGPAFPRAVAVHAGVVTNPEDAGRAMEFFRAQGYRSRAVGAAQLGTRVYVEAWTLADVERIVATAQEAGFVGPYPSRYEVF